MYYDLILTDERKVIDYSLNKLKHEKIIVCKEFDSIEQLIKTREKLRNEFKDKVIVSPLIKNEKEMQKFRKETKFLAIAGEEKKANLFALNKNIKILLNPITEKKMELDLGLMKNYAIQKKILMINFNYFNERNAFSKALMLKNLMTIGKAAMKAKTIVLTVSGATKLNELRKQKDLKHFTELFLKNPKENIEKSFKELFEKKEFFKVIK